jgi:hypothetical protein
MQNYILKTLPIQCGLNATPPFPSSQGGAKAGANRKFYYCGNPVIDYHYE